MPNIKISSHTYTGRRGPMLSPILRLVLALSLSAHLITTVIADAADNYCAVYVDDFSSGKLNMDVWTKQVECGGFGNSQFEMTTADDENSYIKDGKLYIVPTFQDSKLMETDNVLDLGSNCTSSHREDCVTATNLTAGTIVSPIKSARLHTMKGASIKYGRVEVTAKLPQGDWLWPGIWMLPKEIHYGIWPLSGEIDIAESRGNNYTYPLGGNDIITSTLHWGPSTAGDAWWRTSNSSKAETTFSDTFHTFGMEWTEKYIRTYVDSEVKKVLYAPFDGPPWQRGEFGGSTLPDPWSWTGRNNTPFDQEFYLIIDVAVGGNSSWFLDGAAGKPWTDNSVTAARDFWNARDRWEPTWKNNSAMVIDSVKIWTPCDELSTPSQSAPATAQRTHTSGSTSVRRPSHWVLLSCIPILLVSIFNG